MENRWSVLLSVGLCAGPSANLTMQSCMILFQSSPVTIRKRTVIALPAVEKLACLGLGETDRIRQLCKDVFYCLNCIQPHQQETRSIMKSKVWSITGVMLTGWCSLRIWQFQREQRQQMHSRGGGGTCPRWWRSSCTCWLPRSTAASSESPLFITHRHTCSKTYFLVPIYILRL